MKIQLFPYLAFGATFKNFFGLFAFFWDPWCLRSSVDRNLQPNINKPNIQFWITVTSALI